VFLELPNRHLAGSRARPRSGIVHREFVVDRGRPDAREALDHVQRLAREVILPRVLRRAAEMGASTAAVLLLSRQAATRSYWFAPQKSCVSQLFVALSP
jgi:hypothetical protein